MKLSKIILFSVGVIIAITLTGCSEKMIELSSSEQNAIASYSAHTVALYNAQQEKGYVQLSEEYLNKLNKEKTEVKVDTKQETEPTNDQATGNNQNTGQPVQELVSLTQAIGIANLEVTYLGLEVSNGFLGENAAYEVTPDSGKKLLALKFQLMNQSKGALAVNMLQQNATMAIKINETKITSSMITILPIDMGTLTKTIGPGEKQEVYLFFQVFNQTSDEIKTIDFIVQRDSKDYMVKVK